jgi:hypothetical protein
MRSPIWRWQSAASQGARDTQGAGRGRQLSKLSMKTRHGRRRAALLDFAERSQAQREPRSARNPLSLKAVIPTDRCKTTERRKTTKHVIAMQALGFGVLSLQHPGV